MTGHFLTQERSVEEGEESLPAATGRPLGSSATQERIGHEYLDGDDVNERTIGDSISKISGWLRQTRYVAYVIPSAGATQWVDLGEAVTIDRAVEAWRTALRDPNRADVNRLARALDQQSMQPVRKLLGKTRTLLLSP